MDPSLVDIGLVAAAAPALGFVYHELFWHASYKTHKLQKMDQSAVETQAVETGQPTITPK